MALRLLEVHLPSDARETAEAILRDGGAAQVWSDHRGSFGESIRAVIGSERTGMTVDRLHEQLSSVAGFRILVMSLDAVLPRPPATQVAGARDRPQTYAAVSREEVYASIQEGTRLTSTYVLMVALATLVAAIGMARNNTAAVIGAMVVAPLLAPNMGIALGFTLGDRQLLRDAIRASLCGVLLAFLLSVVLSWIIGVDPASSEIEARTHVALTDMLLALAAGAAGTLAYTTGAPTYLVGVMVAVALLPPTVASGLLIGAGDLRAALGAMLLVGSNVAAVTLAAMATFRLTGMRPRHWWREEQARSSARLGILVFAALALGLAALVVLSQRSP